ncbi:MAG: fibronectin type III domain-containing protein, partial [Desulfobacteraceae bacterium]
MKTEKNKLMHNYLSLFIALTILFLFSACGDSQSQSGYDTSDTGSISFKLAWQEPADQRYFREALSGDACIDYAIETVSVDIYDSTQTVVASESWPCSAHEGTIEEVPVGSDMTLVIDGVVDGNVDWRSESAVISIYKDRNTDVGTLAMYYVGDDEDAPTPNPATWASPPAETGTDTITMTATTGSDASGPVEYYFGETSGNPGGSDSDWQTSPSYTDTGLSADTQYTYRVRMRDVHGNTGDWSTSESATTQPDSSDEDAPTPNPATWASPPAETGTDTITMTATTGSDASGSVEYYFGETSGNAGGSNSGWQTSPSYTDTGLSADTQYTYRV